jgi:hypothetical protein
MGIWQIFRIFSLLLPASLAVSARAGETHGSTSLSGGLTQAPVFLASQVNPLRVLQSSQRQFNGALLTSPSIYSVSASHSSQNLGFQLGARSESGLGLAYEGAMGVRLLGSIGAGVSIRKSPLYSTVLSDLALGTQQSGWNWVVIFRDLVAQVKEVDFGLSYLGPALALHVDYQKFAPLSRVDSNLDLTLSLNASFLRADIGVRGEWYSEGVSTRLHYGLGMNLGRWDFALIYHPYRFNIQQRELAMMAGLRL